ncbi:hypothetical protein ACSHWO_02840 [Streptomyces sp. HUAS TT3]|uniref:hypothetical protein n=1 Tax=Streptomyces sp. HUAS TT3 TaxID=3447510 RepID=UPI003F65D3C5
MDPLEVARRARRTGARAAALAAGPEWTRGAPLPVPPPLGLAAPADVRRRAGVGDPPPAPGTDRPGDGGDEEKPR